MGTAGFDVVVLRVKGLLGLVKGLDGAAKKKVAVVLGAKGSRGESVGAVEGPDEDMAFVPFVLFVAGVENENWGTDLVDAGAGAVRVLDPKAEVVPFSVFFSDSGPRGRYSEDVEGTGAGPYKPGIVAKRFPNPKSNLLAADSTVLVFEVKAAKGDVAGAVAAGPAAGFRVTVVIGVVVVVVVVVVVIAVVSAL